MMEGRTEAMLIDKIPIDDLFYNLLNIQCDQHCLACKGFYWSHPSMVMSSSQRYDLMLMMVRVHSLQLRGALCSVVTNPCLPQFLTS
jgi:hypothetical protein